MITKSDWQDAYDDLIADGRKRVAPPTFEEVEALMRGDLPEDDAERVREQLAYYPDLARVMTEPMPMPAEPEVIPIAAHRRPRYLTAAAAALIAVAAAAVYLQWINKTPPARPMVAKVLYADGQRGNPEQTPIQLSTANDYQLQPVFGAGRTYREYRLDLLELEPAPERTLWSRNVHRQANGSYPVQLSTAGLAPGRYALVLYGLDGESDRLATYTLRLSAP